MLSLLRIHHVAIIASDYAASKRFYTEVLGLRIVREVHRAERRSWKLDLALHGQYVIELFSFPAPPPRPTRPEAAGLRHLAFAVADLDAAVRALDAQAVPTEPIRIDEFTNCRFTFCTDPDGLPIEFYEQDPDFLAL
ncbi:MAG: VOC family protein [Hymenobacter sp.]